MLPTFKTYLLLKHEYFEDILKNQIDFDKVKIFIESDDIYIGAKAQLIIEKKTINSDEINNIKLTCRQYYIEICKQILYRIKFDDKVLIAMQIVDPINLASSIVPLMQLFPNLVDGDVEDLDEEWRSLTHDETISKDLGLEEFWNKVFKIKNCLDSAMYPKIRAFLGNILSFPHSSATAEHIFSQVNIIKDRERNSLATETVSALLMAKEVLNGKSCDEWVPSKNLLWKFQKR